MKEEAIAPFCHFEQQEQQLKTAFFQILEFLIYTGNFSKLSNTLLASVTFEGHQGFQTHWV